MTQKLIYVSGSIRHPSRVSDLLARAGYEVQVSITLPETVGRIQEELELLSEWNVDSTLLSGEAEQAVLSNCKIRACELSGMVTRRGMGSLGLMRRIAAFRELLAQAESILLAREVSTSLNDGILRDHRHETTYIVGNRTEFYTVSDPVQEEVPNTDTVTRCVPEERTRTVKACLRLPYTVRVPVQNTHAVGRTVVTELKPTQLAFRFRKKFLTPTLSPGVFLKSEPALLRLACGCLTPFVFLFRILTQWAGLLVTEQRPTRLVFRFRKKFLTPTLSPGVFLKSEPALLRLACGCLTPFVFLFRILTQWAGLLVTEQRPTRLVFRFRKKFLTPTLSPGVFLRSEPALLRLACGCLTPFVFLFRILTQWAGLLVTELKPTRLAFRFRKKFLTPTLSPGVFLKSEPALLRLACGCLTPFVFLFRILERGIALSPPTAIPVHWILLIQSRFTRPGSRSISINRFSLFQMFSTLFIGGDRCKRPGFVL